jgi:hypothetical protein
MRLVFKDGRQSDSFAAALNIKVRSQGKMPPRCKHLTPLSLCACVLLCGKIRGDTSEAGQNPCRLIERLETT